VGYLDVAARLANCQRRNKSGRDGCGDGGKRDQVATVHECLLLWVCTINAHVVPDIGVCKPLIYKAIFRLSQLMS
jgi:hypothetical protein